MQMIILQTIRQVSSMEISNESLEIFVNSQMFLKNRTARLLRFQIDFYELV
jgi:hypothetical protein